MFNITIDTLRYYERIEVIPPVPRNSSGYREYRIQDLNWIYLVTSLRKAGLSIESLIDFSKLSQLEKTSATELAQKEILIRQLKELNKKMNELEKVQDLLKYKIETFDEHVAKFKLGNISPEQVKKLWEYNKEGA